MRRTTPQSEPPDSLLAELARAPELVRAPPLLHGTRVGRFEILEEIGRGGFGVVYEARDTELGRRVALKVARRAESPEALALFRREAETAALFNHPSVVTLHDHGVHEGRPYLVLERLRGETLAHRLRRGRPTLHAALEIAAQIARALVHAHDAGVVHRDLKPQNVFLTDDGQVKVLDFGLARLEGVATGGTPPYMPPELGRGDAVTPRVDLFALGVVLFELATGAPPEEAAGAKLETLPARVAGPLLSLLEPDPARRTASAREALERLIAAQRGSSGGEDAPFRWLEAFTEEDAAWFFGREREAARLERRLAAHALLGVIGPSGAGKSSLVRAGLVPRLRREGGWEVIALRPGARPLHRLAEAAGLDLSEEELAAKPGVAGEALRARARAGETRVLLVVDQLEELYTHGTEPAARRAFAAALAAAADDDLGPVRVVITLRDDFIGRTVESPAFLDVLGRNLVALAPPGVEALAEALAGPAERAGFRFEAGLVDEMVAALAKEQAPLPLLQLAASRLWDLRDRARRLLERSALERSGGVAGLLATHANEVVASLAGDDERAAARELLVALVTPERTRRLVSAETRAGSPKVLERLIAARLVTASRGDGGGWIELAHESLIESWAELRRWLDEDAGELARREELARAAGWWQAQGRPRALLWSAARLEGLSGASAVERDFVGASRRLAARRAFVRRAATFGLPLLAAAAVATSLVFVERSRAAAHAAERRLLLARASQADPLTGSLMLLELARRDPPPGAHALARKLASQRVPFARWPDDDRAFETIRFDGAGERFIVVGERGSVRVGWLDGRAPPTVLQRAAPLEGDAGTAELLDDTHVLSVDVDGTVRVVGLDGASIETVRGPPAFAADLSPDRRWLIVGLSTGGVAFYPIAGLEVGRPRIYPVHTGGVHSAVFGPGGALAATSSEDGTLAVWRGDGSGPISVRRFDPGPKDLHFSPDGETLSALLVDGTVTVWPARGEAGPRVLGAHNGWAQGGSFSRDGSRVVTESIDGTARVWPVAGGAPIVLYGGDGARVENAAISADGARVATVGGEVRLYRADGTGVFESLGPGVAYNKVKFSPDGETLVAAGGGAIALWRVDAELDPVVLSGMRRVPSSTVLSRDGRRMLTGSNDGSVRIFTLDGSRPPLVLGEGEDMVSNAAWSPDERQVVAGYQRSGAVRVFRADGRGDVAVLRGPQAGIAQVAWRGGAVVAASLDGNVYTWRDGAFTVTRGPRPMGGALIDAGVTEVLCAEDSATNAVRVLFLDGRPPLELSSGDLRVSALGFSPDGARAAVGYVDGTARVFPVAGGSPLLLTGHTAPVSAIAMDRAGTVVTASQDGTARVHSLDREVTLRGHTAQLLWVELSPDGRHVVTTSDDRTARVWRVDGTGDSVVLAGHSMPVTYASFSPDGARVITASYDRTVRVWRHELADLTAFLAARTQVRLTDDERARLLGAE